ncbi:MAG: hypothetical protein AB7L71_04865 [Vicinamibacterales bacterium]
MWRVALVIVALALGGFHRDVGLESDGQVALPERLTHDEYWAMSLAQSEPSAPFLSDNLVSNEMSFAQVVPQIRQAGTNGGAYLGVGPEQNFTYLDVLRPRIAFIVDIRRENLLLHLMYKALFDVSPDRRAFLANLFGRPVRRDTNGEPTGAELMDAVADSPEGPDEFRDFLTRLVDRTLRGYAAPLDARDFQKIREFQLAFFQYGPAIGYATTLLQRPVGVASFANLMSQTDAEGRNLGFLASESGYRFVRDMHRRNMVIAVVGNFAGPRAIRGIGQYLRQHDTTVSAFYVSNVEDYLGRERSIPRNGDWQAFCRNAATLPITPRSVFIRPHGLAVVDSDGLWRLSKDMVVASASIDRVPPTTRDGLPDALSPIAAEVAYCAGQLH